MQIELHFLDYIWKGLVLGAITSTICAGILFITFFVMKRAGPTIMKWFFNTQYLMLFLTFIGGFGVALLDPELVAGCFNLFVQQTSSYTLTRMIAAAWSIIAAALLIFECVHLVLAFRTARRFLGVKSNELQSMVRELATKIGVRNPPLLLSTAELGSPFVFGFFRHKLIVPQPLLETLDQNSLRNVLAHEFIHIKDRDSIWGLLEVICRRLIFFNPLLYIVNRIRSQLVELAADEQAIGKGELPVPDFVESLLSVVFLTSKRSASHAQMMASTGFKETKHRIESLAQLDHAKLKWWTLPVLVAIAGITLALLIAETTATATEIETNVRMCSQINHEKIIESWLRIKSSSNKCEQ